MESSFLEKDDSDLPGDIEGGMPGRNTQRKHGTTRGSPRRSRTAKASLISRIDGEIAMCPRVGRMGLISGDGLGQNNPVWSGAAKLVGVLAGESPARGACPVAPVVISGGGEGDQSAGSPEVKNPRWLGKAPVSSGRRASKSTGRSESER